MEKLENLVTIFDYLLESPRKRHIVGGICLSMSFLFAGLAITSMTLKSDKEEKKCEMQSSEH